MNTSAPGSVPDPSHPAFLPPPFPQRYAEVQAALAAVTQEARRQRHLPAEEREMTRIRMDWLVQALTDEAMR